MKLPKKLKSEINIEDLYAIKIKSIWQAVRQEHISFWALTMYFFFDYVRPQSIYPVLEAVPWGQIALSVTLISVFFDRSVRWVSNTENKLFIIFFLIVILSGFFAFRPSVSWEGNTVILNWFLLYFLVINIINSEKRVLIFILGYLLFSFKMAQHGFFVWAMRDFAFTKWGLIGAGGYFQNSGEYAIQMLIFGGLSAAFVLALRDRWGRYKKWFFYFMPFTGVMTVLGASSRGSQLGLLIIGLLLMFKFKAGFKALIFLILVMVAAYYLLPEEQIQRFSNIGEDSTSLTRFAYWDYGWQVMLDHPILGVGYDNWLSYAHYDIPSGIYDGRIQLPHNIYIEAGAELGFTGLLSFILLIIFAFITNARTRKIISINEKKLLYLLTYGLDMGLVGYLVAGTFVTVLYYPFFWVQIAMIVAVHNVSKIQGSGSSEQKVGRFLKKQIGGR